MSQKQPELSWMTLTQLFFGNRGWAGPQQLPWGAGVWASPVVSGKAGRTWKSQLMELRYQLTHKRVRGTPCLRTGTKRSGKRLPRSQSGWVVVNDQIIRDSYKMWPPISKMLESQCPVRHTLGFFFKSNRFGIKPSFGTFLLHDQGWGVQPANVACLLANGEIAPLAEKSPGLKITQGVQKCSFSL